MLSLGLWQNFGDDRDEDTQRAILRRAFDRGVTHFDLANNYGPPYGRAEENFGRYLEKDLAPYRDELVISTKAGYDMWPVPTARAAARGSTCCPRSTSPWAGWGWTTWTSSTATASTRRRRSRRRCPRSTTRSGRGRRSTPASRRTRRRRPGGRDHRARPRHAAAHPPAVVLDAQPLDRGRPARRARGAGHGVHRVHGARAGPAHRPLPRRGARRLACRTGKLHA